MLDVLATGTVSPSPRWLVPAEDQNNFKVANRPTTSDGWEVGVLGGVIDVIRENFASRWIATSDRGAVETFLLGWKASLPASDWYFELARRLRDLANKAEGWKGDDSHAAIPQATKNASDFLWKLSQEGIERRPSIGLDHEGTFSFMWMDEDVKADLTVYEDGTYSFFAAAPHASATADEARLSEPLDSRLLSILLT